ncbi:MAG TPA: hypothetical protein VNE40_02080 [Candidatus Dormibacteraeota bacterium]|nr:hypothetical protein [Candidatus Dormibacteraeota bacterium]
MISVSLFTRFAAVCPGGDFLGLPKWYKYLQGTTDPISGACSPQLSRLSDIWLIVAAVIELLLRVAAIAAVAFVIVGGIKYTISQGEPDKTAQAKGTIINAVIGLAIAVVAAATVQFIAGSFK